MEKDGLLKSADGGEGTLMDVGDAFGIGAFCCIGTQNALRLGLNPGLAMACGMVTSTFGGLTRDTLFGKPGRILQHGEGDIYALTAVCGSAAYLLARGAGASPALRIATGMSYISSIFSISPSCYVMFSFFVFFLQLSSLL